MVNCKDLLYYFLFVCFVDNLTMFYVSYIVIVSTFLIFIKREYEKVLITTDSEYYFQNVKNINCL